MSKQRDFELDDLGNQDCSKTQNSKNEPLIEPDLSIAEQQAYQDGIKKVNKLGFAFMVLFLAYGSSQNLVSSLYKELNYTNLGVISLFVVYICFAVGSLISKQLIQKVSYKWNFTLSNLGYSAYIASGVWVFVCSNVSNSENSGICSVEISYFLVIITAGLCGFAASTLWVGQGRFVDEISNKCPSKRGSLFGSFFSWMGVSTVFGSIFASAALKMFGNTGYFIFSTSLSLVSAYLMFLTEEPKSSESKPLEEVTLTQQALQVLSLLKEEKVKFIVPFFCMRGVIVVFYASFIQFIVNRSLTADEQSSSTEYLSYVIISLGIFGVISSIIAGKLADKYNIYTLLIIACMICGFGVFLSLLGLYMQSYTLCFVIASVWGFCDSFCVSLMGTVSSRDFPGQPEIFALQQTIVSISISIAFIVNILLQGLDPSYFLFYLLFFQIIATISIVILITKKI